MITKQKRAVIRGKKARVATMYIAGVLESHACLSKSALSLFIGFYRKEKYRQWAL